MPDIVTLNGAKYSVDEIRSRTIKAWAEPVRVTGNEARVDRRNASAWNQESLRAGMGYYHCLGPVPDDPSQAHKSYVGCFDSTVETRYDGVVTLAGLPEVLTQDNDHDYYRFFEAQGASYTFPAMYAASHTASESIARVDTLGTDMAAYKDLSSGYGTNYVPKELVSNGSGISRFWGGTLSGGIPGTIVQIGTSGAVADFTPTTNMSHVPYSVILYQDVLWATTVEATNNRMQIEKSTDGGDNWANVTGLTLGLNGSNTNMPHQYDLIIYEDQDGVEALYMQTNDGLFFVDTTNSILKVIIKFSSYVRNGQGIHFGRPLVWGGNLYLPRHGSLIEYNARSGFWEDISPLTQLRMASDYGVRAQRGVVALTHSDKFLFVGIQTTSVTDKSKVLAYDGFGWHFIWESEGTGTGDLKDIKINNALFNTPELFIVLDDNENGESIFYKISEINVHPEMTTTKKYKASGNLIMPWFTAGMSEVDATWLAQGGGYKNLDDTNEEVNVDIALDFSDTYETDAATLSEFNADTVKLVKMGSGTTRGPGVQARAIRNRYTFSRGATNTNRPLMIAPVTYYKKKPKRLHEYGMLVNLEESAKLNQSLYQGSPGKVLRTLHTTEEAVPLVKLQFPGQHEINLTTSGTDLYVDVQEIPATIRALPENQWLPQIKEGTALVVCQQILD